MGVTILRVRDVYKEGGLHTLRTRCYKERGHHTVIKGCVQGKGSPYCAYKVCTYTCYYNRDGLSGFVYSKDMVDK